MEGKYVKSTSSATPALPHASLQGKESREHGKTEGRQEDGSIVWEPKSDPLIHPALSHATLLPMFLYSWRSPPLGKVAREDCLAGSPLADLHPSPAIGGVGSIWRSCLLRVFLILFHFS